MKSRTSFFNFAVFKKDITRFAPLWVLYTIAMCLTMLSIPSRSWTNSINTLGQALGPLSFFSFLYGALAAQLLFGDLFNSRLCNALHAMPTTREARFGSHLAAGFAFSFVPNLLVSLLLLDHLGDFWYVSFLWLAGMTLQYLFFFGVGILAAQLTGNRFAMVMVYGIINFLSLVALWFAEMVFLPFMPGVVLNEDPFVLLCPVGKMITLGDFFYINYSELRPSPHLIVNNAGWTYMLVCVGIGIVLMAVSLLLYRRRALETAGEFIAVKPIAPAFLVLYTLCAGGFLSIFSALFYNRAESFNFFLLAGLVIGFFTGKMLLERTAKVFRKKAFLHLGILAAALMLSIGLVKWDVFGIVRYVPQPEEVSSATVTSYFNKYRETALTDPNKIENLCKAHQLVKDAKCDASTTQHQGCTFSIVYHLKNGRTVARKYHICSCMPAYAYLRACYTTAQANNVWNLTAPNKGFSANNSFVPLQVLRRFTPAPINYKGNNQQIFMF